MLLYYNLSYLIYINKLIIFLEIVIILYLIIYDKLCIILEIVIML